jgi:methionyl-tRNA formyltransferase
MLRTGGASKRLKILKAEPAPGQGSPGHIIDADLTIACVTGAIRPLILQREGKEPLPRGEFLRGFSVKPHDRFA